MGGEGGRGEDIVLHVWENLGAGECEGEEVRGVEINQQGKRGGEEEGEIGIWQH